MDLASPAASRAAVYANGLREEYWPRAFENGVMRKIFSRGLGEVTVLWELLNEQLCDLYS